MLGNGQWGNEKTAGARPTLFPGTIFLLVRSYKDVKSPNTIYDLGFPNLQNPYDLPFTIHHSPFTIYVDGY